MARLEAEVTADIGPFERALNKATEKAREFAEKTKDATKDVLKEAGGGQLFNLAGLAGTTAALTAFGVAIKDSLEAFGHMETQVLRLKGEIKDPEVAKEVHEWIESIALSAEESEHLHAAFISLSESGMSLKQIKPVLEDLQAIAFQSGESVDSLTEAFRRAKAGGLDAGEGALKLLKSVPGLAKEIDKYKEAAAQKIEFEAAWGTAREQTEAHERAMAVRAMTPADFVKSGMLTTDLLIKLIHEMAPRGMVAEARGTLEGAEGRLSVVLDNLKESFGEGLAPTVKELVKDLNDNLPSIEANLHEFGEAIGAAIKFIEPMLGLGPPKPASEKRFLDYEKEWEDKMVAGFWRWLTGGKETKEGAKAAPLSNLADKEGQQQGNASLDEIAKILASAFST